MTHSGGSLIQRSSNAFHKSVVLHLEQYVRKLIMSSLPYTEVKGLLLSEIDRLKTEGIDKINNGQLTYKDFMISRNFKKTKNVNYKMYQDVLTHNKKVLDGTNTNNVGYISQGDRYYTVLLIPTDGAVSKKTTDHLCIVNNTATETIPGMKIYFDHYWRLIHNDIENRFSMWQ